MAMRIILSLMASMILLAGCTIKPPAVNITSERTALEKQLLGTRERLTDDPFTTAAVWSTGGAYEAGITPAPDTGARYDQAAKRELIIAQIRRQAIQGDLKELKRAGYVGERNDGTLAAMSDTIPGYEAVVRLLDAENNDRLVIMNFYSRSQGRDTEEGFLQVRHDFAAAMAKASPTGTWTQNDAGDWVRK